ncbi:MAG: hypothetical protein WBC78_08590, partial [Candidatus Sulfotelmatobacter sp.]
ILENPLGFVGPVGNEHHQESHGNPFRQSDGDFLICIPAVDRDIDRGSQPLFVFDIALSEFPVNVDTFAFAFP